MFLGYFMLFLRTNLQKYGNNPCCCAEYKTSQKSRAPDVFLQFFSCFAPSAGPKFDFSSFWSLARSISSTRRAFGPSQGLISRHVEHFVHRYDKMFEIWDIMSCAKSYFSTRRAFCPSVGLFSREVENWSGRRSFFIERPKKKKNKSKVTAWTVGLLECIIVKDDTETGFLNVVPLWEFGLLY